LRPSWRHAESPRSSSITSCARVPRSISIADSALAAIEWVSQHVAEYGGDPTRISLLGHSAGAHLCAVGLGADWRGRGIDPPFIRGAVLVSGIFDPAPAMYTTLNADLRLTPEIVARHDVERRADCRLPGLRLRGRG
jgi:arylformamidase